LNSIYNKGGDDFAEHNAGLNLREKTLSSDISHFMDLIRNHCYNDPPSKIEAFSAEQAKEIISYQQMTYFKHFNLYKYCSDEKQKAEFKIESIMIDEPQAMEPLGTFEEIQEEKAEEAEEAEVEEKAEDEAEKEGEQQESERKEKSDYDKLDPEIRKMIDLKI
jgi:hypothetical protein